MFFIGLIFDSIPTEYEDTYNSYFDLNALQKRYRQKKAGFKIMYAREHPVTFAFFMLGKRLRIYQAYAIDLMLKHRRVALNWARRKGKSLIMAVFSLWNTFFNKEPKNKIEQFTTVGIVSKEDKAAKKLLQDIRNLIYEGDMHMSRVLKLMITKTYFTDHIIEPNNTEQITWDSRSYIASLPPTKKVRGYGFSRLFIDEMAWLDPKDSDEDSFYFGACMNTVGDTNGSICISSTPNGCVGLYHALFDPDGDKGSEYIGFRLKWNDYLGDTLEEVNYSNYVEENRKLMTEQGRYNLFRQEFMADFTVTQTSFYENDDIQAYFDKKLTQHYEWHKSPCSLGLDYGITVSKTVIIIKTKYRNKIITVYHKIFPAGYDINELMNVTNDDSIPRLNQRFSIAWIIPDDCASGDSTNKWMIRQGYVCEPYSMATSDKKNKAYYKHKAILKSGVMKSYPIEELRHEMQTLQEEQLKKFVSIGKPRSGSDDVCDADVFATVPFFDDDEGHMGVSLYEPEPEQMMDNTGRLVDTQWIALNRQAQQDIKDYHKKKSEVKE